MQLSYKSRAMIADLTVGECTMHRASGSANARWWQLWFCVPRKPDGVAATFCVPMNPGKAYRPDGPGGKTWGLTKCGPNAWQVSPSINVEANGDAHATYEGLPSLWHETPTIVGVPDDEPWACGDAP